MRMQTNLLAVLLLIIVAAGCAYSQQTDTAAATDTRSSSTATDSALPAPTPYVFPDKHERFRRYVKSTIGPFSLARDAVSAGLNQWDNSPPDWGQGARGFGKRYASSFGGNLIHQTVEYGLNETLHLDGHFERSQRDGFFPRLKDALVQNVSARTRSGDRVFSIPKVAGYYAGGIIPKVTWYPDRYSYKDGLRSGTKSLLTGFGINVFREFVWNF
jgi:hypothetical protein